MKLTDKQKATLDNIPEESRDQVMKAVAIAAANKIMRLRKLQAQIIEAAAKIPD